MAKKADTTDTPRKSVALKNEIVRAPSRINSVLGMRLFLAFASMVTEEDLKGDGSTLEYSFDLSSLRPGNEIHGSFYRQVSDAAKELCRQIVGSCDEAGQEFHYASLFAEMKYSKGVISATILKSVAPQYIAANARLGGFTVLQLREFFRLPSIYSQRLYMVLRSYHGLRKGFVDIQLAQLHEQLDTPASLRKSFKDFRRRVLDKAFDDITTQTGLSFYWQGVCRGRAVVAVRFTFVHPIPEHYAAFVDENEVVAGQPTRRKRIKKQTPDAVIDVQATPVKDPAPDPRAAAPAAMTAAQEAQRKQLAAIVRRRKAAPAQEPETTLANSETTPRRARPKKGGVEGKGADQLYDSTAGTGSDANMEGAGRAALLGEDAAKKSKPKRTVAWTQTSMLDLTTD